VVTDRRNIVTILVAISRMYLGVHYLTDVLVGAALGITTAYLLSKYFDKIKNITKVYNIMFVLSLIAVVVLIVINYLGNMTDSGIDAYQFYFDTEGVMKMLGTISGFVLALNYEKIHVQFENHRQLWHNIIRFVLGIVVILAVRFGLKFIFSMIVDSDTLLTGEGFKGILAVIFDFIRYTLILFIGIGLYPKSFKYLKI